MKVLKKCDKCGKEFKVEPSDKVCSECGGKLLRQFSGSTSPQLGQIVEDEFVKRDREMLMAVSPKGHDRSCY